MKVKKKYQFKTHGFLKDPAFGTEVEYLCECNVPEDGETIRLIKIIRRVAVEIKTVFHSLVNELQTFSREARQLDSRHSLNSPRCYRNFKHFCSGKQS